MKLDDDKKRWEDKLEKQIVPVEPDRGLDSIAPPLVDFEELAEKERRIQKKIWGPQVGEA